MKAFATILMIGGLMLASLPHLLCPITCAKAEQTVSQVPKCPHCGNGKSEPRQAPPKDCDCGCCDHVDALPSTSHAIDVAQRTEVEFLTLDFSTTEESVATLAADRNVQSPLTAFSAHPGCALPVLLGHLLL
jgi:hypothetical protein